MAKIYISSTFSDLEPYRKAVYDTLHQLGHQVFAMEDYVATDQRPVEKCLADVEACDIYVGIFAFRYGYIPPPEHNNPDGLSITELEFRHADTKAKIPCLALVVSEDAPWPSKLSDAYTGEGDHGQRIKTLRDHLCKEYMASFFSNPDQLARLVSIAVQKQLEIAPKTALPIDWEKVQAGFLNHMHRFAGAPKEDPGQRYMPLQLQSTKLEPSGQEQKVRQLPVGDWNELVNYPCKVLLRGEAGSGKTTLLLHEVYQLAERAQVAADAPLPLYFSLQNYVQGGAEELLTEIALANALPGDSLSRLWEQCDRPIALFLDAADEVPAKQVEGLSEAIDALCRKGTENADGFTHSVVIASRERQFLESLLTRQPDFLELLVMPLKNSEIYRLLRKYGAARLAQVLDPRLLEVLQTPDLLSALAQSVNSLDEEEIPQNAGQIYRHLIDRHLFGEDQGKYSYLFVKRPILSLLAFRTLVHDQPTIAITDDLLQEICKTLENLYRHHERLRCVMPFDWSATDLLAELIASRVMSRKEGEIAQIAFPKRGYRDYFAAVYLGQLGIDSPEMEQLWPELNPEQWIQPLILLLGLQPQASRLFERFEESDLQMAVQLWFENRPANVTAPEIIVDRYLAAVQELSSAHLNQVCEPITLGLLESFLKHHHPRQRLAAVRALSQWGLQAIEPLLEAAGDESPLVRAVAEYALIHLGEASPDGARHQPFPPLLDITGNSLAYSSFGGGFARLGSLTFLQVPMPGAVTVYVDIEKLDLDPFEAEAKFVFLPTPPAITAAYLFELHGGADWVEFAARCWWIATLSLKIVEAGEGKKFLNHLACLLKDRAVAHAGFGELICRDLGLAWPEVGELPLPHETLIGKARQDYNHLRRLYARANQSIILAPPGAEDPKDIKIQQNIERIEGTVIGMQISSVKSEQAAGAEEGPAHHSQLGIAQNVKHIEGQLSGVEFEMISGAKDLLPLGLRINGKTSILNAENAAVTGLRVQKFKGKMAAWQVDWSISIGSWQNSHLSGVVIDDVQE